MIHSYLDELTKELCSQQQNILLVQLNDLVSRDLLVIEQTQPILIQDIEGKIRIEQSIKLSLKEMDYIKKLEDELGEAKKKIEYYEGILQPTKLYQNGS